MPRRISDGTAATASRTLVNYGKQSFEPDAEVSVGQCLGMGLRRFSTTDIVEAAATALEDDNAHTLAAMLRAINESKWETVMNLAAGLDNGAIR